MILLNRPAGADAAAPFPYLATGFQKESDPMGRLIVASNRTATPGGPRAGGLAVALWDALTERGGGVWFGWSGEVLDRETRGVRVFSEGDVDFALADLTEVEHEGYYLGYANRTLWPVFHYRVDLAHFDDGDYEAYEGVNRRFGKLLSQFLHKDDVVWVHDYHFLLLGQEIRNNGWRGPIGFFLHIPFPAPEVFTALPSHNRLAHGLAAFDLIGFQTQRDVDNFRRYMIEHQAAEDLGDGRLRVFDHTMRILAVPIGIDPEDFSTIAAGEEGREGAERLGRILESRALVLGVDRMDYSKGLPQRFQAFGRLLDDTEELRGKVTFVQIAPPSREAVLAYQDLREELDKLSGRINGDYSDLDWTPIRYLARNYRRETLAGLYRLARVGLVTPLHDGMNLVAKEFVAAQDPEDPGVLILSEFAGAADQLEAALMVNPHDIGATADAIRRALEMPVEERRERWRALFEAVSSQDIAWWRRTFLEALDEVSAGGGRAPAMGDLAGLTLQETDALILDFDGTLVDLGDDPDAIWLDPAAADAMGRLSARLDGAVAVLSGRDVRDLARRTPPGVWRAGGHGLETLSPGAEPGEAPPPPPGPVLAALEPATAQEGVRLEIKGPVAALHYRAAPEAETACLAAADAAAEAAPGYVRQQGKMVVEVKPDGAHKGEAVRRIAETEPFAGRRILFLGDDATDEDAIAAAQALGGLGVKIGEGATAADLRAPDPAAVRAWLLREAG